MCGIVGYIGSQDAKEILLTGLEKLEYRGYDSAGIALLNNKGVHVFKEKGRIAKLRESVNYNVLSNAGIGHTRWATHGSPNRKNAHPHQSKSSRFTIVHNGVIENYNELKLTYLNHVPFLSDTDTEVVVQLIEKFVEEDLQVEEAFTKTLKLLKGSYAVALMDHYNEEKMYVGKNKSPLLIGIGDGFHMVASDAMPMLQLTDEFVEIMDEEIVIIENKTKTIKNLAGDTVEREPFIAEIDASDIEKGTYPHYMLKEIDEQPLVLRNLITNYLNVNGEINIGTGIREAVTEADRIYIIACGTSYHAGLVGKQLFEKMTNIPVETHIASEFLYNRPVLSSNPLFIFISQSGETADSRGVLVDIKKLGYNTLTITNVLGSTLSREADYTLYTYAGPEIAVASTKAYTAQIAVLSILAIDCMQVKGENVDFDPIQELSVAANAMEVILNKKEKIEDIILEYLSMSRNCFFIGRSVDYYVCLEGALKLKEISYIQAEGFAGGELKHGTIALVEEGTPVIAVVTQPHINNNIRGNVQEVLARGAKVCMISMEGMEDPNDQLVIPKVHDYFTPLVSVIPLQLIAYYAALYRDCDVDKPRNLAKSVTVE